MLVKTGNINRYIQKLSIIFSLLFILTICKAAAQPPVKDPSNPDVPTLPTQMSPAELNRVLKEDPSAKSSLGQAIKSPLDKRIVTDSLVKEATPQSANVTEQTYGMHLFRGGAVASITDLSTPPLDYPIGV